MDNQVAVFESPFSRRQFLRRATLGATATATVAALAACGAATTPTPGKSGGVTAPSKLRFGVGPLQPTAEDSKKTYEPFFKYLADALGTQFDLVATTDWAGISVALANEQVDLA